jgi:L-fuconolactonase
MVVDGHVHFWRYDAAEYSWIDDSMAGLRRDFLPHDLKREMADAGVEACVAVQARQSLEETRWLLELADAHPFIAGVVGWVDLRSETVRSEIERFATHRKLIGLRHIVQSEPDDRFLLGADFCRGISELEAFDLAYDILIYPRHLAAACEFVARFPRQRFVLDHLAKPEIRAGDISAWEKDLRRLAKSPRVFCKLSGLVTEADWSHWTPEQLRPYLDVAWDCFGPERLMIGTDWPVCTVAASYRQVVAIVEGYCRDFPAPVRDAVMGGNARTFWRLTARELV